MGFNEFRTLAADPHVRMNVLITLAYGTIVMCFIVSVFLQPDEEWVRNIILLLIGRFMGYLDSAYQYDFGQIRKQSGLLPPKEGQ